MNTTSLENGTFRRFESRFLAKVAIYGGLGTYSDLHEWVKLILLMADPYILEIQRVSVMLSAAARGNDDNEETSYFCPNYTVEQLSPSHGGVHLWKFNQKI